MKRLLLVFILVMISVVVLIHGRSGEDKGVTRRAFPLGGAAPELLLQTGHHASVIHAGLSPDGTYVLAGGDGEAPNAGYLLDTETGRLLRRLDGHRFRIDEIAFSPDETKVATVAAGFLRAAAMKDWRAELAVWDVAGGDCQWNTDIGDREGMVGIAFHPDGKVVTRVESGDYTLLFDVETGELVDVHTRFDWKEVVWSPTAEFVGLENRLLDGKTGRLLREFPDGHTICDIDSEGKRVLVKIIRGWAYAAALMDAESGRTLGTFTILNDSQWIVVTPEGYFHGSDEAQRAVSWRIKEEVFPLELYADIFHRPDLVAQSLRGEDLSDLPVVPSTLKPPEVRVVTEKIAARYVMLAATATPGSDDGAIVDARIFVDGRDLATVQGSEFERKAGKGGQMIFRGRVDFPPGKNRTVVAVTAVDEYGLRSLPAVASLIRPGPAERVDRRLLVLTVGVSDYGDPEKDLNFAHADAEALASLFQAQEGLAYEKVEVRLLTNEKATASAIREGLKWLEQTCKRSDTAIVHFSGHGGRDRNGTLYYIARGADPANPADTLVRWDNVGASLQKVKSSGILFLADCCHAGAFGYGQVSQDELASLLRRRGRVMVFASSKGTESSLEMGSLGHGDFTYALLNGLNGAADFIADKRITVSELQTYVCHRVPQLTDDRQHPHLPLVQDFAPEMVIVHVK